MRRSKQELDKVRAIEVLEEGSYGVLSVADADGQYAVPLSYSVFRPEGLESGDMIVYFHGAREGRKREIARAGLSASFCVVGRSDVVPRKLTVAYESAIAFGTFVEVLDPEERQRAFLLLASKYAPSFEEESRDSIDALGERTAVFALRVESLSGKCGALLVGQ